MPTPPPNTIVQGVFQGDLIIRSAVVAALDEMYNNSDLLDYVFSSMTQDPNVTTPNYGTDDIKKAKDWFLNTNIPVKFDVALSHAEWPCISVSLLDSVEAEFTIGDVHYQPSEPTFADWPIIVNKFTPVAYSPSAGLLQIPATALNGVILDTSMFIMDRAGNAYQVLNVLDDSTIEVTPNIVADFTECVIKGTIPGISTPIESINNKETYQLTLYVGSEPIHLIYLHSILTFALNRRKQDLLEGRGFERSTMSSGRVERFQPTENEVVYARTINLVGWIRNSWIKPTIQIVQGIGVNGLTIGKADSNPPGLDSDGKPNNGDLPWTVDSTLI